MADFVHFPAAREMLTEDERVRAIAKRAVAELGFPFDAIYLEMVAALMPLEFPAGAAKAGIAPRPGK
jgi:hypothetical protein